MSLEHSPARAGNSAVGHPKKTEGLELDRFIDERECKEITNLSRVTRWRLMRRGQFPVKVQLSPNRTAWRLSAVLEWMSQREAAS